MNVEVELLNKEYEIKTSFRNLITVLEMRTQEFGLINDTELEIKTLDITILKINFLRKILNLSEYETSLFMDVDIEYINELVDKISEVVMGVGTERDVITYGLKSIDSVNKPSYKTWLGELNGLVNYIKGIKGTTIKSMMTEFSMTLDEALDTNYIEFQDMLKADEEYNSQTIDSLKEISNNIN